jgi:hypothetical protein
VIQGMGRVCWRRVTSTDPSFPAGMGLKFVKLEDGSRTTIERIVQQRGGAPSRFDQTAGAEVSNEPDDPEPSMPAPAASAPKPASPAAGASPVRAAAPKAAAPAASAPAASAQSAALGEMTEFDLALLLQQLVDPARQSAHARGVDVQLVYPDGVPSRLIGHPMPLYRALEGLLRQALRTTRKGQVALRVNRAGDAPDSFRLRFEVSDTGVGIPFKEQAQFADALAGAAGADPSELKDPVLLASALANALGGELAFESQPGQGSRFGFTLAFKSDARRSGTVFMRQSAFTPAPALAPSAPVAPLNGHPQAPASRPGAPSARR